MASLACGAIARVAWADTKKIPRVGLLVGGTREAQFGSIDALEAGMRELGYVEGTNVAWERRFAEGHYERLPQLAAELVELKVDVIVSGGTPSTRAAQHATKAIPIVGVAVSDAVGSGFVKSLARPEGNITGLTTLTAETVFKRIELLKSVAPAIRRVAHFFNPANPIQFVQVDTIRRNIGKLGMEVIAVPVSTDADLGSAFDGLASRGPDSVSVGVDAFLSARRKRFAQMALAGGLPSVGGIRQFVEAGGLASYGPDVVAAYRGGAAYVDRILRGASPHDLPFVQTDKFELCLNRTTAAALRLAIPQDVLLRADAILS